MKEPNGHAFDVRNWNLRIYPLHYGVLVQIINILPIGRNKDVFTQWSWNVMELNGTIPTHIRHIFPAYISLIMFTIILFHYYIFLIVCLGPLIKPATVASILSFCPCACVGVLYVCCLYEVTMISAAEPVNNWKSFRLVYLSHRVCAWVFIHIMIFSTILMHPAELQTPTRNNILLSHYLLIYYMAVITPKTIKIVTFLRGQCYIYEHRIRCKKLQGRLWFKASPRLNFTFDWYESLKYRNSQLHLSTVTSTNGKIRSVPYFEPVPHFFPFHFFLLQWMTV